MKEKIYNTIKHDEPEYDPLTAVAFVSAGVDVRDTSGAGVFLQRIVPPRGKIASFLSSRFGLNHKIRVQLDQRGSAFFRLVNGEHTLNTIEQRLRQTWGLEQDESRRAVIEYTKMLMRRGLVSLKIKTPGEQEGIEKEYVR